MTSNTQGGLLNLGFPELTLLVGQEVEAWVWVLAPPLP